MRMNQRRKPITLATAPSALALLATLTLAATAHAADPTTADCLGASEASVKLRSENKLRDARAQLLTCAAASCPADIRAECSRRVEQVNAQIPTIVFEAKDGAGNDLTAVKVTMDGKPLAERLEGTAISLDPGEHKFVFEVAGQAPITKTIVLRVGEKERRERIVIGPAPTTATTPPAGTTTGPGTPPPGGGGDTTTAPVEDHTTRRVIGFVIAGLGVASGIGSVLEFSTASSRAQKSKDAAASTDPNVQATVGTLHDQAAQAQTFGIVFAIAGGAALATGIFLIATSGSSSAEPAKASTTSRVWLRPNVGAQGGGLQFGGSW